MPALKQGSLYTRKEVATMAKVCVHTIARDVRAGLLQEVKFNRRRLRYTSDAVQAYLCANYPTDILARSRAITKLKQQQARIHEG